MSYSHRNGEAAPPTVPGWYGVSSADGYETNVIECDGEGEYRPPGSGEWHPLTYLADRGIRFWGPWEPWAEGDE